MKAVVVASGDLAQDDVRHLDGAALVVAADGGAARLDGVGRRADVIVGDLDSTEPALVERWSRHGTRVERHPADKEASDTELAIEAAIGAGATEVVLLGATGGERIDHALANLTLLADPDLGPRLRVVRGDTLVLSVRGGQRLALDVDPGDLVTLLPIGGDVTGVTTEGLRWALGEAMLRMGRSRGLSNEAVATGASVRVEQGVLLVVITRTGGASA